MCNKNVYNNENTDFKFNLNQNNINVEYKNKNYTLSIVKDKRKYYLKVIPYGNSFFSTEINFKELRMKTDMSLFAIMENEKIYG